MSSWQLLTGDECDKKDHPITTKMIVIALVRKIKIKFMIPFLVSVKADL